MEIAYEVAKQLARQGFLLVPLLSGRCYPENNWWKAPAEAGDVAVLLDEERFTACGDEPGLALYLDPRHGLVHLDGDVDVYKRRHGDVYKELEDLFPKLRRCPKVRTPSRHINFLIRCPEFVEHRQVVYYYKTPYNDKEKMKTAFELRPPGCLFPIIGKVGKSGYRLIVPLPSNPDDIPIFTLDEVEQIWEFLVGFVRRRLAPSGMRWNKQKRCFTEKWDVFISRPEPQTAPQPVAAQKAQPAPAPQLKGLSRSVLVTYSDVAAYICRSQDILKAVLEEFDIRTRGLRYIRCPFHGPDKNPSVSIYTTNDGRIRICDWHSQEEYDIPSLYHALRTGEEGRIDKQLWHEEVLILARKFRLIPEPEAVKQRLADVYKLAKRDSLWHGVSKSHVQVVHKVIDVLHEHAIQFGNFYAPLSARVVAQRAGVDLRFASRALNLLCAIGIAKKGPTAGRTDTFRLNPRARVKEVVKRIQALVKAKWRGILSASQNVIAEIMGAAVAAGIYRRQSDAWEAARWLPAWRRTFVAEAEKGSYRFIELGVKRKMPNAPPVPDMVALCA